MTEKRFRFGFWVSVVWILFISGLLFVQRADALTMKPNEWGDLFAGVFAPLAFLWLVLGYLQQGEELKLSTRALLLQAEELKNSVEQQRALVEVSRQQVESEREALAYERQLREDSARPNVLVAPSGGSFRGDGVSTYNVVFTNTGNTATGLLGELVLEDGQVTRLIDTPFFDRGAQHRVGFTLPKPLEGASARIRLSYKDTLGRQSSTSFAVARKTEHPHSELSFSKVEV